MLLDILQSDYFLYPIYLAIKAAYLPTILLGGEHLMAELIAVIVLCVFIALLGGAAIKWWLKLPLIAASWALVSYPYMEFALLSLPVWPFLFWRRRYWGLALALVGLTLGFLIGFGLFQLDGSNRSLMYVYMAPITFVIMRVRLPMLQRFRATVLSLLFAFLVLYSAPKVYQNHIAQLLAKLPSLQPQIVWIKEPEKGEEIGIIRLNNVVFNEKFYQNITLIFKDNESNTLWWHMAKTNKIPKDLDIYGYVLPAISANEVEYKKLIQNDLSYQDFKDFLIYTINKINHKDFINLLNKKLKEMK